MAKAKAAQIFKQKPKLKPKVKKPVVNNKPKVPDLTKFISLAELARRAGTSRQAVTQWIKLQEKAGIKLAVPAGRRGKLINPENPLVKAYAANTYGKAQRNEKEGETENKSPAYIRKLQWQVKRINLINQILRKKYIERGAALESLDQFLVLEEKAFSGFSDSLIKRIEKKLTVVIPPEKRTKAQELIDTNVQSAKASNRRLINDFKESTCLKNTPAKSSAA
jgi:biotin operon repressor